jgi:hypothetical protein
MPRTLLILIVARRAKKAALPNDGYNLGTVNSLARAPNRPESAPRKTAAPSPSDRSRLLPCRRLIHQCSTAGAGTQTAAGERSNRGGSPFRGILTYRTGTFTSGHTGIAGLFATSKIVARGRARTQPVRMYEEDRGTVAPDTIAPGIATKRAFASASEYRVRITSRAALRIGGRLSRLCASVATT